MQVAPTDRLLCCLGLGRNQTKESNNTKTRQSVHSGLPALFLYCFAKLPMREHQRITFSVFTLPSA